MKKLYGLLVIGVIVSTVMFTQARADEGSCCKEMMRGKYGKMEQKMGLDDMFAYKAHFIMENSDELGITEEQAGKIKALKYGAKKNKIKNDAEVELLVLDIKQALEKETIDLNATNALVDKKYSLKSQAAKDSIAACAELKKILTKDQQKKMKEIWVKEMKEKDKCMLMQKRGKMMGKEEGEQGKNKDM